MNLMREKKDKYIHFGTNYVITTNIVIVSLYIMIVYLIFLGIITLSAVLA